MIGGGAQKRFQLTLLESTLLVANAAAAINLWLVMAPHWGRLQWLVQDIFMVSR